MPTKCNCLDQANEKLHAHLMEGVPEGSELGSSWDGCGWDNQVMSFGKNSGVHVMLRYRLAYRLKKKNGELAKNFTRKECSLKMTYCPLCGNKLEGDE
ncbi:hypothetical protein [Pantoea sp. AS-PWVM4]|uniref:hypothetical protein n=1 Tax=Pantoea sp. AS-PWVM4 TaxID=1332069 RepID=UPI00056B8B36|nr:hypothetical protein [Pantoea sp. AS-PWVM4]